MLVERTRVPELDGARALLAKGFVGQVEVWRCGASFPAMRFHCELAAKLTVEEAPNLVLASSAGIHVEDASTNAVSTSGGCARTGKDDGAAVPLAGKKLTVLEHPSDQTRALRSIPRRWRTLSIQIRRQHPISPNYARARERPVGI